MLDAIEVLVDEVGAAVWLVVLLMIVEEEDRYATSNPGLDTVSVDSDTSSADRSWGRNRKTHLVVFDTSSAGNWKIHSRDEV